MIPGSGRSPGKRNSQPTPAFLPGKSCGHRSLATVHGVAKELEQPTPVFLPGKSCGHRTLATVHGVAKELEMTEHTQTYLCLIHIFINSSSIIMYQMLSFIKIICVYKSPQLDLK